MCATPAEQLLVDVSHIGSRLRHEMPSLWPTNREPITHTKRMRNLTPKRDKQNHRSWHNHWRHRHFERNSDKNRRNHETSHRGTAWNYSSCRYCPSWSGEGWCPTATTVTVCIMQILMDFRMSHIWALSYISKGMFWHAFNWHSLRSTAVKTFASSRIIWALYCISNTMFEHSFNCHSL